MTDHIYNVLFLCTGNSARSIMAEAMLNKLGAGRFRAFSAGSRPKGAVNPVALEVLVNSDFPVEGLHSKSWSEFTKPGAPEMDFIFTVCDDVAGEACPVWAGHASTAHWGIEDPALVEGTDLERRTAFVKAQRYLKNRIQAFASLPIRSLDGLALKTQLAAIGQITEAPKAEAPAA
ncbi:arsenate reductase [Azorhizobium oxalatiphilum]|uniref:Arsenate reductase n=1 Tax=Azorhizobium oxalatiphilum TaxID=980631 RepID=A0A917F3J6_9HYPH|nr:arsenate reductase ArsC [Azorhizobium oxalatiphilum]GGF45492.1 arsenate reductase [Azorhizobium oxalatiphilum]